MHVPLLDPAFLAYVAAFALAGVACLVSLRPIDGVDDADTRRGLRALLVTSGGWAFSNVAFLVLPTVPARLAAYTVGLVLGFAAVGAWLYFCSAYTGRAYHHDPAYRRAAVVVFAAVVAVKLTNPLHGAYFATTVVDAPFPHVSVYNGPLHWVAMGLSYALAFVGYFMLLELFTDVDLDARPLSVLLAATALPVVLDVVGYATPFLLDVSYEPLGVAVFAVGVAYVHLDEFEAVRFAAERDVPTVALDRDGDVRDANRAALALFPALDDARGRPFADVLPDVAAHVDADDPLAVERDDATRYYRVVETPYGTGRTDTGRTVALDDVTERERYRRELERQNERLETFASMVSHDLRNPLNVAQGELELLAAELDDPTTVDDARVARIDEALERMQTLVDDILALARHGQPVDDTVRVHLATVATQCWTMVDTADATLDVPTDIAFHADPDRLKRLLENLVRNAIDHGGRDVAVTVGALDDRRGFYVEDDGPGIPESDRDRVFETGHTTAADGTGFGLAIVAEIADAHGWTVTATTSETGGARFEITGVEPATDHLDADDAAADDRRDADDRHDADVDSVSEHADHDD